MWKFLLWETLKFCSTFKAPRVKPEFKDSSAEQRLMRELGFDLLMEKSKGDLEVKNCFWKRRLIFQICDFLVQPSLDHFLIPHINILLWSVYESVSLYPLSVFFSPFLSSIILALPSVNFNIVLIRKIQTFELWQSIFEWAVFGLGQWVRNYLLFLQYCSHQYWMGSNE